MKMIVAVIKPSRLDAVLEAVTEAGGIVTTIDADGDPKAGKQILAANPEVHGALRKVLQTS